MQRRLVFQASSSCWPESLLSVQLRLGSRGIELLGRRRRRPFLSLAATSPLREGDEDGAKSDQLGPARPGA